MKAEHLSSGGLFKEIVEAADLYGVFEDLYGRDKFFRPCVQLKISFDFDDDYVTPVHRGSSFRGLYYKTLQIPYITENENIYGVLYHKYIFP